MIFVLVGPFDVGAVTVEGRVLDEAQCLGIGPLKLSLNTSWVIMKAAQAETRAGPTRTWTMTTCLKFRQPKTISVLNFFSPGPWPLPSKLLSQERLLTLRSLARYIDSWSSVTFVSRWPGVPAGPSSWTGESSPEHSISDICWSILGDGLAPAQQPVDGPLSASSGHVAVMYNYIDSLPKEGRNATKGKGANKHGWLDSRCLFPIQEIVNGWLWWLLSRF